MTPRSRSTIGTVAMLAMVPAIVGLLACMPVPIGDPERSRIDPDITGIWVKPAAVDWLDECVFYVFEPYDKRTWLTTCVAIEVSDDFDGVEDEPTNYDELMAMIESALEGDDDVGVERLLPYKVWLKRLGGSTFMTWEPKNYIDEGIKEADAWFVYRLLKHDSDRIELHPVNGDGSDLFDDIEETRRAYERVIKKHADNPELYVSEGGEILALELQRVKDEHLGLIDDLLNDVIGWN